MTINRNVQRALAGLAMLASVACSAEQPDSGKDQAARGVHTEGAVVVEEFVSRTPGAKIYSQPPRDSSISLRNIGDTTALVDSKSGDMLLTQEADRERHIMYFAYITKDRELVRVFMTQWGGGTYKKWKVFPIRVWNIEEAKKITPAVDAARPRATIERFAKFLSSWPDFKDRKGVFMVIDAPVSEVDPL